MKKMFMVFAFATSMVAVAEEATKPDYVALAKDKATSVVNYASDKAQVLATKLYPTKAINFFQKEAASNPVRTLLIIAGSVIALEKAASYVCSKVSSEDEVELVA